jgi:hypothetical protein
MYIGVLHTVTNKAAWATKLKEFENATLPDGFENPISYMGANTDYAFCLWDVPSADALKPVLDKLTEGAASNMYFPVDPNAPGTVGMPAAQISLVTPAPR